MYSNFSKLARLLEQEVLTAFPEINATNDCTAMQLSQRTIESTVDSCTNTSSILTTIIDSLGKKKDPSITGAKKQKGHICHLIILTVNKQLFILVWIFFSTCVVF